jgi:hypothetical protein
MRLAGKAALTGKIRNSYKILLRKPEANRPLGRPWLR